MVHGYEFQSDFAKRHQAHGEARALLAVLEARQIEISETDRDRILACSDLDQLDRWVRKAATIASTDELFAD